MPKKCKGAWLFFDRRKNDIHKAISINFDPIHLVFRIMLCTFINNVYNVVKMKKSR